GMLFPENINGHPIANGYSIIADELYQALGDKFNNVSNGLAYLNFNDGIKRPVFIDNGRFWLVNMGNSDVSASELNFQNINNISPKQISNLKYQSYIDISNVMSLIKE
ncbi:MAG: hypothetical protein V3V89_05695, partial [Gammaproteobacteria bacterium]